jgi:AcrR family transcriptional regulator
METLMQRKTAKKIVKEEILQKPISRRERRGIETRERIFRAALRLFAERGFMATTIDAIAQEADIGKSTFFNYFDNKESILLQFREKQMGKVKAFVLKSMESDEPLTTLVYKFALIMTEEQQKSPSLFGSLMSAAFSNEETRKRLSEGLNRIREALSELIKIRQKAGDIRSDIPSHEIAYSLQRLIFGSMLLWSISQSGALEKQLSNMINMFVNSIKR